MSPVTTPRRWLSAPCLTAWVSARLKQHVVAPGVVAPGSYKQGVPSKINSISCNKQWPFLAATSSPLTTGMNERQFIRWLLPSSLKHLAFCCHHRCHKNQSGEVGKDKSFVMSCANAKDYSPKACVCGTVQRTYSYAAVIYNSYDIGEQRFMEGGCSYMRWQTMLYEWL